MSMHTHTSHESVDHETAPPPNRARWLLAGAASIVVIIGLLALVLKDGDETAADTAAQPPMELSLGAGDSMASCMAVDPEILAGVDIAFAATATALEDEIVTLEVDRWYTGGDASIVQLHAESGQAALTAGFDFQVGNRYLVSATDGSVNFCGLSGPDSPDLRALFDEAFAS